MSQYDDHPAALPDPSSGGVGRTDEADALLDAVERDVILLDESDTNDQVGVYERMHTALADALARTADTGAPTGPEHPGA